MGLWSIGMRCLRRTLDLWGDSIYGRDRLGYVGDTLMDRLSW